MTPVELADILWKILRLRKAKHPDILGLSTGATDEEFVVHTTDGRLVVTVRAQP